MSKTLLFSLNNFLLTRKNDNMLIETLSLLLSEPKIATNFEKIR